MRNVDIILTHPKIPDTLIINTGANEFSWGYKLNTQSYPTYAGEVVQILSAYIDNIKVTGEVKTYAKMEQVYRWFLVYFGIATQGSTKERYNEEPVRLQYPARGWDMYIQPISLPGLHYGTEVVVPTWTIEAVVVEADQGQTEFTKTIAQLLAQTGEPTDSFDRLTSDIGWEEINPFSRSLTEQEKKGLPESFQKFSKKSDADYEGLADTYNGLLDSYRNGDFTKGVLKAFGNKDTSGPPKGSKSSTTSGGDTPTAQPKSGTPSTNTQPTTTTPPAPKPTTATPSLTPDLKDRIAARIDNPPNLYYRITPSYQDWFDKEQAAGHTIYVDTNGRFVSDRTFAHTPSGYFIVKGN